MIGQKFATKVAVLFVLIALSSLPVVSRAQESASRSLRGHYQNTASPEVRVTARVDDSKRTILYGHVPGALSHATDLGRLDANTPAEHLVLVLRSSDTQKAELRRVLDDQQDSRTENYHQWLTPDEFGTHFGVHDEDIAKVSAWLESQGFKVEDVSKSKRVLHFSGTTGQLERAFQTQMRKYQVNGETHVSNNSEISVPTALSPVIAGISLHNFFRKNHMGPVRHLKDIGENPLYGTSASSTHYVGPWDFATIYNTFPLLNAGITGAGSSIAVVGRSDILLSDVQSYRQLFDLPVNDPVFIHAGQDNGIEPGDDGESDLDVEISGGIAPNAKVSFVIGTPTFLVDGITNSIQYIVENNTADIMSISYGSCEGVEGAGGNEFNNQAFEQAAAQGISVFVAAGDNGPAECDVSGDNFETGGYATGGEASTPYSVAVGGTEGAEANSYWITTTELTPPYWGLSALSYFPESPWNEAKGADKTATASASLSGLWSGSGGISSYYLRPSWQTGSGINNASDPAITQGGTWVTGYTITKAGSGYTTAPTVTFSGGGCTGEPQATATIDSGGSVTGLTFSYYSSRGQGIGCTSTPSIAFSAAPAGGVTSTATATIGQMWNTPPLITGVPHRLTPDLALNAASGHDATLFCSEGVCEFTTSGSTTTLVDAGLVGGTSVAAPSMAGIQALIDQANGGRQGAPNYIYYALAAAENTTGCNSSLPPASGSNCAFQDITVGDNLICGTSACTATTGTKIGFHAGVGYDLATGLGSVNATNLSSQWKNVVFHSSNTTLNLSKKAGIPQGGSVTFSGKVSAGSGSGTPTGDVAFILSKGAFGSVVDVDTGAFNGPGAFATLSGGAYTASLNNLPAGTYTVTARYGGDETYASSLSAPVTVTVTPGNSKVAITAEYFNDTVTCSLAYVNSYTYGQFAWIPAAVTATSGYGKPTGTVTFTVDGTPYSTETLDPQGHGYLAAGTIATSSCLYGYIFAQSPTLTGGVHFIGASYSGDSTFSPATATPVKITVNPLAIGGTVSTSSSYITSGASVRLTAAYTAASLTGNSTQSSGPTGTVTFTDTTANKVLGTATVIPTVSFSGNTYTFAANAALTTTGITGSGAHSIAATYSGDSNFSTATSGALTITVGTPAATTTVVTSSANPTTLNGRPTLTATVTGTPAVTSGAVSFYDSYTGTPVLLGTSTVGTAHTATFRPASGAAFWGGAHPITAVYAGIAASAASTSAVFAQSVTLGTNTIQLTGKTAGAYGQTFTFAAVLTPSSTNATFAPNQGVVTFYDGSTAIGTGKPITVTSAQGGYGLWTATVATSALSAGTHTIAARYSDINYSLATSNTQSVTVNKAVLTVKANNLNKTVGSANPPLTVSYSGFVNGDTSSVLGGAPTLTTTARTSSGVGAYPITVTAGALAAANYSFAFVNGTLSIVSKAPVVKLTTTATLSGTSAGGYTAIVKVTNTGTAAATGVTLTTATLGGVAATGGLPKSLGPIAAGGSATATVTFSGVGTTDNTSSVEQYAGTYSGGTFSGTIRVTLP